MYADNIYVCCYDDVSQNEGQNMTQYFGPSLPEATDSNTTNFIFRPSVPMCIRFDRQRLPGALRHQSHIHTRSGQRKPWVVTHKMRRILSSMRP